MKTKHTRGGLPWWKKFTPLTTEQETNLALPCHAAFAQLLHGEANADHFGTMIVRLRLGKKLTQHFEKSEELNELLNDALVEIYHCIENYRTGVEFTAKVDLIHDALRLVDDLVADCEGFRVRQAIKDVVNENLT